LTAQHPDATKPHLPLRDLWNISFGFFGIQIGFALQNANMSRVFQSLGSNVDDLAALWVAAPLTGLLVQPVIGHLSDRTWLGRLGRRRPYFLAGAVLAALALAFMPLSSALLGAALLLWLLDASLNVSMEPFRAFVGDMLGRDQHTAGYAVQTAFIGVGAVVGSLFPSLLDWAGVANTAPAGHIPDTVRYSFWAGGAALLASVLWTVLTTQEYSPRKWPLSARRRIRPPPMRRWPGAIRRQRWSGCRGRGSGAGRRTLYAGQGALPARRAAHRLWPRLCRGDRSGPRRAAQHALQRGRRFFRHASADETPRAGAVLQLVGALRDVDLFDAHSGPIWLQHH
jgi:MFS family permease